MDIILEEKLKKLKNLLENIKNAVIAFSGGVDSTFLLKIAKEILKDKVLAVTLASPLYPERELKASQEIAGNIGVKHLMVEENSILKNVDFINNPPNRCYLCKRIMFKTIFNITKEYNFSCVADGSNMDDLEDYRPGRKALEELGVRSPLLEVGLSKKEIRELSKKFGLSTADKPSLACLASRFPYGHKITKELLKRVDEGEEFLRELGIKQVRVRNHNDIARIEVDKEGLSIILMEETRKSIVEKFHNLGYVYVSLDLECYRTGSMNESIKRRK